MLIATGPTRFGAAQAGAVDTRLGAWLGSWKLLAAQSSVEPPNRLSVTPSPDGSRVKMSGETHLDFTAKRNGHDVAAPGNLGFNQIDLHAISRREAEVKEKKNGALVATIREKIAGDGNELTTRTSTPGKVDRITVWTRIGGAKVAADPFAGEWMEDLGKSRLRQGLTLKIEASGSGGVNFQGDSTYSARFDRKPYDVKNSRNDNVVLELLDLHTIEATYRRDNQVAQVDRWLVSADGKGMALSSTATLESGQRVVEKLEFKRQ